MQNRWNNGAKSILEKVMQKTWKNSENGSQKGSNICENVIKNEVRKLDDFGRLFWRRGEFWATQRLEGEVYLTLKGGTLLGLGSAPSVYLRTSPRSPFPDFFDVWDQLFANQNSSKIGPRMKPAQIRKIRPMGAHKLIFKQFMMTFGIPFGIIFRIFSQTAKSLFLNNSMVL